MVPPKRTKVLALMLYELAALQAQAERRRFSGRSPESDVPAVTPYTAAELAVAPPAEKPARRGEILWLGSQYSLLTKEA